jgi:hypothetical protein
MPEMTDTYRIQRSMLALAVCMATACAGCGGHAERRSGTSGTRRGPRTASTRHGCHSPGHCGAGAPPSMYACRAERDHRLLVPVRAGDRADRGRLPRVLEPVLKRACPDLTPPDPREYHRQYLGIVHAGGRRTVYVNAFRGDYLEAATSRRCNRSRAGRAPRIRCNGEPRRCRRATAAGVLRRGIRSGGARVRTRGIQRADLRSRPLLTGPAEFLDREKGLPPRRSLLVVSPGLRSSTLHP